MTNPSDGTPGAVIDQAPPVDQLPMEGAIPVVARVNLIPAIYARRVAVRTAKLAAVAAVMGALLVVALLWLVTWQKATSAQEDSCDAATFERTMLQTESARYSEVPVGVRRVALAQDQLQLAMGNEVRWSFLLNDLALTMPSGVGLDTLDVSVTTRCSPPTPPGDHGGPPTKRRTRQGRVRLGAGLHTTRSPTGWTRWPSSTPVEDPSWSRASRLDEGGADHGGQLLLHGRHHHRGPVRRYSKEEPP